jgi:hypothetical protein
VPVGRWAGVDSSDAVQEPTYYAGKIAYFVKIVAPAAMDLDAAVEEPAVVPDLRLAVMDLHLLQRLDREIGVMYQSVTYCSGISHYPNTALSLSFDEQAPGAIVGKHALALEAGKAFFLPYSNMSASGEDA